MGKVTSREVCPILDIIDIVCGFFSRPKIEERDGSLQRPLREGVETIFGTVYDHISFIEQEDPKTHAIKYSVTLGTIMSQITEYAIVPTLGHAQPIFLTAIAVNRFTAFAFPLRHASMWGTRTVVVVTISLIATSVILGSAYPATLAIYQAVACSRATRKQRVELNCDGPWAFGSVRQKS